MDLLPKNHKQFQEEGYWSKFFQDKQTKQGFEWYATFEEIDYYLKQSIKDKESKVLVVGCGNSLLSEKLQKGIQLGKDKVVSIDFEEKVIKHMKNRGVDSVEYLVMDALNMTFENGSFNYAVDKGTLDALCSDRSPETTKKVIKYFNEVIRVLSPQGGTYICISLLQDFVLDALVSFFNTGIGNTFSAENTFDFRIQKIEKLAHKQNPDGTFLIPFYVSVKRTQIPKDPKFEVLRKKMTESVYFQDSAVGKNEMIPITNIHDRIKKEQISQMFIPKMKELNLGQKYELFCYDKNAKDTDVPRYTLTVIDSNDAK